MPRRWLYVRLAERFGGWPEDYRRRVERDPKNFVEWVSLLGVEALVHAEREGLGPDDTVSCDCFEERVAHGDRR